MTVRYKLARVRRLAPALGPIGALRFEMLWTLRIPEVRVTIPELGRPLTVRRGDSDISVLEGILVDRECDIPLPRAPGVIIDAGANVGFTTAWFATRYPKATVIAVEPSTDNCRMLRENCRDLANVVLLEGALCPYSGWARIRNPDEASWAFSVERCEASAAGAVPAFTVLDALAAARTKADRVDLLKVDIEGGEYDLFSEGVEEWLPLTGVISVETHNDRARAAVLDATRAGFIESRLGEKTLLVARELSSLS